MRLELIFFIGVFCNILMAMIFPFQLLPPDVALSLASPSDIAYNINDDTFGSDSSTASSNLYTTLSDTTATGDLSNIDASEVSFLDSISNFFDGLAEGLKKLQTYFMLLLPFGAILGLLPGAIGAAFELLYMAVAAFAIIKFIRSG